MSSKPLPWDLKCYLCSEMVDVEVWRQWRRDNVPFAMWKYILSRWTLGSTAMMVKSTAFWDVAPCSRAVRRRFWTTYWPHLQDQRLEQASNRADFCQTKSLLPGCLAYSSTLKSETVRSSETSLKFYKTKQCHIPEDSDVRLLCWALWTFKF
jgi:hypothetical protein